MSGVELIFHISATPLCTAVALGGFAKQLTPLSPTNGPQKPP